MNGTTLIAAATLALACGIASAQETAPARPAPGGDRMFKDMDADGDGTGEPVLRFRKPRLPVQPAAVPAASDEFDGPLGLQWQWNSNPAEDWASLANGTLRLKSVSGSPSLYEVGNLLSQKLPGERFTATTVVRFAPLRDGERTGLVIAGRAYGFIGIERFAGQLRLIQAANARADSGQPETVVRGPSVGAAPVWL